MVSAAAIPGRYQPLPHVLFYDDFDDGLHGWTALTVIVCLVLKA